VLTNGGFRKLPVRWILNSTKATCIHCVTLVFHLLLYFTSIFAEYLDAAFGLSLVL